MLPLDFQHETLLVLCDLDLLIVDLGSIFDLFLKFKHARQDLRVWIWSRIGQVDCVIMERELDVEVHLVEVSLSIVHVFILPILPVSVLIILLFAIL